VAFTGRRKDLGDELAARLGPPSRVLHISADHCRPEDCARSVSETRSAFGRIDILFNNAGVVLLDRNTEQTSEEEWAQVMSLNVTVRALADAIHVARIGLVDFPPYGGCVANVQARPASDEESGWWWLYYQ